MTNKERVLWITRTAIFMAMLLVMQWATRPLGQYVTGSLVNLILIVSVMLGGLWSGVTVALLSPLFAFMVGIGPAMPPVIPVVMLGNLSIVLVWHFIAGRAKNASAPRYIIAVIAGAVVKFLVLYTGIVKILLPFILNLPEKQTAVLSASFSFPQLFTALIGGTIAAVIIPLLKRGIKQPAGA